MKASPVMVLVDYDNVEEINRRRGLVDLLSLSLLKLPANVLPDNTLVSTRLYGGWYEQDRLTALAETLRSEIDRHFPAVFRFVDQGHQRRVRAIVDLARSLLIRPDDNLMNTFRSRHEGLRLSRRRGPYAGCSMPDHCLMSVLGPLVSRRSCPVVTCAARLRDIFVRRGQKLVDTMLTADAIFASSPQTKSQDARRVSLDRPCLLLPVQLLGPERWT